VRTWQRTVQRRRTYGRATAFTLLVAVSALLLVLSSNPAVRELQRRVASGLGPVAGAFDDAASAVASVANAIGDFDRQRVDNGELRRANDRLAAENARLEEARRENEQLSALLRLQDTYAYRTVAAQVIAVESSELRRVVTIGKGTADGIATGDVVMGEGGALTGRVIDAGPNVATVRLITDPGSRVIGQLPSAATGEVVGRLSTLVPMGRIDATEKIAVGDEVVTASIELAGGIRSAYPKGLVIGRVADVERDANAVVQTAWLLPAAPLDRLEYLLVITDYEGGLPPVEASAAP
jgi:rod shape-determining protein MreC